jgi:hypothetical protein
MRFEQADEIVRGIRGQRRAAEIGVLRDEVGRRCPDIREIAAPPPEMRIFSASLAA